MSFPITHLRVAALVARELKLPDGQVALFLLGALAPDGVHYRAGLVGVSQSDIGATKKASHLCPVSDEPWGYVTDNDGWIAEILRFARQYPGDALAMGYAVHALTDVYNNLTLWKHFTTHHPQEAAKGYASDYYKEMAALDLQLYQEESTAPIMALLATAQGRDFPGRVTAAEIHAIRDSLYSADNANYSTYAHQPPARTSANRLVTSAQMQKFITDAAAFARAALTPK
ncbi:MAG: hypothetical protein FWB88_09000 [Defluviitaleaceae bacterium]|nr:hypothetical protein [Defluviitaleaceae bacterium]MCL2239544.1 hypothetical protein [Defluviitaleaceae bacterium]